jgi:hypothetical protein
MLSELVGFLGAVGIAVAIFITIMLLSDEPVKALIVVSMLSYLLHFAYIVVLNRVLKRKEEKRATE